MLLDPEAHVVEIKPDYVDFGQVDPAIFESPTRYENTSGELAMWAPPGSWALIHRLTASEEWIHSTSEHDAYLLFKFEGVGVRLISETGPGWGRIRVYINGTGFDRQETIDLTSTVEWPQQEVWYSGPLPSAEYYVRFEHYSGDLVNIDAVDIWGTLLPF